MCRPGSDPKKIQVHTPPFVRKFRRFKELDEPEELYGTGPGEPEEEFEGNMPTNVKQKEVLLMNGKKN